MRYKIGSLIALMLALLLCSTGCNAAFADPSALMHPPQAAGELQGINEALNQAIGGTYSFVYPTSGSYRSSNILKDLDGDGNNEAIVFYMPESDQQIHLNLLCRSQNVWKSTFDLNLQCAAVDRVEFADLYGDEALELVIGTSLYTTNSSREKQLSVYSFSDQILNLRLQTGYTSFAVCNLTGGQKEQLLTMSLSEVAGLVAQDETGVVQETRKRAYARLLGVAESGSQIYGEVSLDSGITAFSAVYSEVLEDQSNAVYIDAYKGPEIMITEVIRYINGRLENPFYNSQTQTNSMTQRTAPVAARDIDEDGRTEIPALHEIPGYTAGPGQQYLVSWMKFDGSRLQVSDTGMMNLDAGYYFSVPEEWNGGVTVEVIDEQTVCYRVWDTAAAQAGDRLFTVALFLEDDWETAQQSGYQKLAAGEGTVYGVLQNTSANGSLQLPYEQLVSDFVVL